MSLPYDPFTLEIDCCYGDRTVREQIMEMQWYESAPIKIDGKTRSRRLQLYSVRPLAACEIRMTKMWGQRTG